MKPCCCIRLVASIAFSFAAVATLSNAANAFGPLAGLNCPSITIPPSFLPGYRAGKCELLNTNPAEAGVPFLQHCMQLQSFMFMGMACLIQAERIAHGLPMLQISNDHLMTTAGDHAREAGRLKWWVKGADPHVNPETKSTPDGRIKASGYCGGNPKVTSEIAYTGSGDPNSASPAAAVNWWMNISTAGHREAILNPAIKDMGWGIVAEGADPNAQSSPSTGTYVINFGACQ